MPFLTPLRYPGGKRRLTAFVRRLLETNQLRNVQYVEPFAGGASLALALLYEKYASDVHVNDLSRPVFAFWHTILSDTEEMCRRIDRTSVTIDEWERQRTVLENSDNVDLPTLGFATLFLNRTNRSGIVGGGVIGGRRQAGLWKLDARFPKNELIRRIQRVGEYRDKIHVYQQDALDFTNDVVAKLKGSVLAFYDPPYIERGHNLYLDNYRLDDHRRLARRIRTLSQPWVVTYDYEAAVRYRLFPNNRRLSFELSYSAQRRHSGREAMFLSDRLHLPSEWRGDESEASMSSEHSKHPVFGKLERSKLNP